MKRILFLLLIGISWELKAHSVVKPVEDPTYMEVTAVRNVAAKSAQEQLDEENHYINVLPAKPAKGEETYIAVKPANNDYGYATVTHQVEPEYASIEPSANKSDYMTVLHESKPIYNVPAPRIISGTVNVPTKQVNASDSVSIKPAPVEDPYMTVVRNVAAKSAQEQLNKENHYMTVLPAEGEETYIAVKPANPISSEYDAPANQAATSRAASGRTSTSSSATSAAPVRRANPMAGHPLPSIPTVENSLSANKSENADKEEDPTYMTALSSSPKQLISSSRTSQGSAAATRGSSSPYDVPLPITSRAVSVSKQSAAGDMYMAIAPIKSGSTTTAATTESLTYSSLDLPKKSISSDYATLKRPAISSSVSGRVSTLPIIKNPAYSSLVNPEAARRPLPSTPVESNSMVASPASKSGNATATSKGLQNNVYAPIKQQPSSSSYDAEGNPIYGETDEVKVTASPLYDVLVNPAETSSLVSGHVTTPASVEEPVYNELVYAKPTFGKASATSKNSMATRLLPSLPKDVSPKQPAAAATASSASGYARASSATSVVPPRISTNGTYSSATSASTKMAVKDYNTLLASTQSDMTSFVNALKAHEQATLQSSNAIRKGTQQAGDTASLMDTLKSITVQRDALVANLEKLAANGTDSAHLAVINNTLSVVKEQYQVYIDESKASLYAARLTAKSSFSTVEVNEMKTLVSTYLKAPLPAQPFLTNLKVIQTQEHVSMPANVQGLGQQAAAGSTATTAVEELQTVEKDLTGVKPKQSTINATTKA